MHVKLLLFSFFFNIQFFIESARVGLFPFAVIHYGKAFMVLCYLTQLFRLSLCEYVLSLEYPLERSAT